MSEPDPAAVLAPVPGCLRAFPSACGYPDPDPYYIFAWKSLRLPIN